MPHSDSATNSRDIGQIDERPARRRLHTSQLFCGTMIALLLIADPGPAHADSISDFATQVWPLLTQRCLGCHGKDPADIKGGLDLRDRNRAQAGGDSGIPSLTPGDSESSPLYLAVARTHDEWSPMPPKDTDALDVREIAIIRKWIDGGAPWPGKTVLQALQMESAHALDTTHRRLRVETSGGLDDTWTNRLYAKEDLWAFSKRMDVVLPPSVTAEQAIDHFIDEKIAAHGLQKAPPADRRALIRRVTVDLTGIPATRSETDAFLEDRRPDRQAYSSVVERLLASPAYGEQMARRWLDVVRYADSAGFANDMTRPHAWRYRDYVIRSFHADKPFDRFILEQLAGDELPSPTSDSQIATSFLRMGPWEHTGMAVEAETRQQWLDDVLNSVGNSFLGLEMSCFKCHDHKFDPLPTRDYYRMQAIFAATQLADVRVAFTSQELPHAFPNAESNYRELVEQYAAGQTKQRIPGIGNPLAGRFRFERWAKMYEPFIGGVYNGSPRTFQTRSLRNPIPREQTGELMRVFVLRGGSLDAAEEAVQPGVLSVVEGLNGSAVGESHIPKGVAGRRLALARWLTDPAHPLTARVIVNRVWGWHFGSQPLVGTPNNFGVKSQKPTHPKLLDWLANWFVQSGWSVKDLSRLIVSSAAYRRSIEDVNPEQGIEAGNRWLASFPVRRMIAEEIRDSMLAASGELNRQGGGPPARPVMNWDVATAEVNLQPGIDVKYRPSLTPAERNRRSIYALIQRSRRDPMMEAFDQPASERSCERRGEAIIATQALTLMNGDFPNTRALYLADQIVKMELAREKLIAEIYECVLGRPPKEGELRLCREFLAAQTRHHGVHAPAPNAIRERLRDIAPYDQSYVRAYVPDLDPADVDAETRAVADLALILFNSNEFLYLP